MLPTIDWQDDAIVMIDQRKLPAAEVWVRCTTAPEVARAIKTMVIRGAPAIGVAAAMGIALGDAAQQGDRHAAVRDRVPEDLRPDGRHAADGRQPVLGDRADEAGLRRRRAGRRVGRRDPRRGSSREARAHPRRGRRELPRDRARRRGVRARRRAHPDALQRRRAGDGRLRHRARRHPRRRRGRQARVGAGRRDAARSCRARA